ncbi:MAG TPA: endonuclease/exonuclease/phosphatase family protein [Caulobacteraceae bacterium]|jgi:endonuclease/exonuclease/phosphatase (EEP) superfamily protein YafD|nr:endonuclease/exonuclease/phosphatase family protein [Caulobacteraceae bacterium]
MDLLRAVAFLLAAGSALAAALSLGGAVSDKLDLFAQASPAWLVASLVALIALALTGAGRLGMALAAFGLIVSLALIAPDVIVGLAPRLAADGRQTLKLVQLNVWDRNRDPAATEAWLRAQKADILVLEEFGDGAVPTALADAYPYGTLCAPGCATVILSRMPLAASGTIDWPGLGPRHTGAWASIGQGADAFVVAGAHYRWPIPAGPQREQARRFVAALAPFDRKSLIVAGDFNLNPWSFGIRRQDKALGIPRITHALFSWPAGPISHWRLNLPFPVLALDQIYAGPDWKVVSVTRGPVLGSDHYPVVAVLTR